VRKSIFIVNIKNVDSEVEAKKFIAEINKKHNDARHNVPVYRIIKEQKIFESFSDNGEPKGTAGMPILDILRGRNLVNVCVVVTRYFGGTLLGTGGLMRAYSEAIINVLEQCEFITKKIYDKYEIVCNYSDLDKVKYKLLQNNIKFDNLIYTDKIKLNIFLEVSDYLEQIFNILKDETNNNIEINLTDKNIYK